MKVATGRVISGKVVIEGDPLPEGSMVTVVARQGDEETFEATPDEEQALLRAIHQADRGIVVPWTALRARLRRTG